MGRLAVEGAALEGPQRSTALGLDQTRDADPRRLAVRLEDREEPVCGLVLDERRPELPSVGIVTWTKVSLPSTRFTLDPTSSCSAGNASAIQHWIPKSRTSKGASTV